MKALERAQILQRAMERARKQNKAFSLRALAQKLQLSPGFVSKILNGKAELPFERVGDFVTHLKIDRVSEDRLWKTYKDHKVQKLAELGNSAQGHDSIMAEYVELAEKEFSLLRHWYYIAILDLAASPEFSPDSAWLAARLGLSKYEASSAADFLKSQGFLEQNKAGKWVKAARKTRLPTKESKEWIRAYHDQMMKKASQCMHTELRPEDFERRLITGISAAANPAQIKKAMSRLNEAMYEIADILGQGECTEVFHLGVQLFPVSKPKKS